MKTPPRYLIATNGIVFQDRLECYLSEHGDVDTVSSCEEAIAAAVKYRPKHYALIFIHNRLLKKWEANLISLFHQYHTYAPIVGVGGRVTQSIKKACFRAGIQQVVTQPINQEAIAQLIKTYAI